MHPLNAEAEVQAMVVDSRAGSVDGSSLAGRNHQLGSPAPRTTRPPAQDGMLPRVGYVEVRPVTARIKAVKQPACAEHELQHGFYAAGARGPLLVSKYVIFRAYSVPGGLVWA